MQCSIDECERSASYALEFMKPIYCAIHGKEKGARLQTSICKCGSARPTFGLISDGIKMCCKKCKTSEMKDLRYNNCIECDKRANYGNIGEKALYCTTHKKKDMINIYGKVCEEEGCNSVPSFGFELKKPLRCLKHKLEGMEDVHHPNCTFPDCKERPFYGRVWNKPIFCVSHKDGSMINVVTKRCCISGCTKMPTFGIQKGKATHCVEHKTESMFDVKHGKCLESGCTTRPSYGTEKHKPLYCTEHKKETMVDVTSKVCRFSGCKLRASFGIKEGDAEFCKKHKSESMKDVVHMGLICPGPPGKEGPDGKCPFGQRGTPKYKGMCTTCYPIAYPTDPKSFTIKKNSDELIVRDFLVASFTELSFVHDKPLWTGNCDCTHRRRIDLRTLVNNTLLAIEVDEHQHKYKDAKDEEVRYDDLFMIHSGKWIFIRYNPHSFIDSHKKKRNIAKDVRLKTLKNTVFKHLERVKSEYNKELVEIHKLYYDGYEVLGGCT